MIMDYEVDFCDEANEIITELSEEKVELIKEKQELLELLEESVEQLKSARYCIEDGDCALETGPDWMFDIQEMIEEVLEKYEGDNDD